MCVTWNHQLLLEKVQLLEWRRVTFNSKTCFGEHRERTEADCLHFLNSNGCLHNRETSYVSRIQYERKKEHVNRKKQYPAEQYAYIISELTSYADAGFQLLHGTNAIDSISMGFWILVNTKRLNRCGGKNDIRSPREPRTRTWQCPQSSSKRAIHSFSSTFQWWFLSASWSPCGFCVFIRIEIKQICVANRVKESSYRGVQASRQDKNRTRSYCFDLPTWLNGISSSISSTGVLITKFHQLPETSVFCSKTVKGVEKVTVLTCESLVIAAHPCLHNRNNLGSREV